MNRIISLVSNLYTIRHLFSTSGALALRKRWDKFCVVEYMVIEICVKSREYGQPEATLSSLPAFQSVMLKMGPSVCVRFNAYLRTLIC